MSILFDSDTPPTKTCIYCNQTKLLQCFPKHSQKKDRHDTRCSSCIKSRSREVEKIRKTAPTKPETCECCGKRPNVGPHSNPSKRKVGLVLDHDPHTKKFRGWLCDDCNKSIGSLGDTLEGLMNAVRYLERSTDDRLVQRHSSLYSTDKE